MNSLQENYQENHVGVFEASVKLLMDQGKLLVDTILKRPDIFLDICDLLKHIREKGKVVHITGMGRSGKAGMIAGELLKNIGFNVSYIGKTLARPIRQGDIAIGFSGSGWTRQTCDDVEEAIKKGATLIGVTADLKSKIGRLADYCIKLPGGAKIPKGHKYVTLQMEKIIETPLAPMGTVFELGVILFGAGLVGGLYASDSDCAKGFKESTNKILSDLDWSMSDLLSYEDNRTQLIDVIHLFEDAIMNKHHIYWVGTGLTDVIAGMHAMRFQHLKSEVELTYDWRFRDHNDLLVAISGSGETPPVLHYAKEAREIGMEVLGITAFMPSSLTHRCNHKLVVHGREYRESAHNKRLNGTNELFLPAFEYSTANVLDGIVAQLAFNLAIPEADMQNEHA